MTEATGQPYQCWSDAPVGRLIEVDLRLSDVTAAQRVIGLRCTVPDAPLPLMLVLTRSCQMYGRLLSAVSLSDNPAVDVSDRYELRKGEQLRPQGPHLRDFGKVYSVSTHPTELIGMYTESGDTGSRVECMIQLDAPRGRPAGPATGMTPYELIVAPKATKQG